MILIIGSEGSMGKRYQAILRYLNKDFVGVDKECPISSLQDYARNAQGLIIATPTDTHIEILRRVFPAKVPVLCEKPISKNLKETQSILEEFQRSDVPLKMMYQYKYLHDELSQGDSWYDYFRHGNDGLKWDCFQIIALAEGKCTLAEQSPIWDCCINGQILDPRMMDEAYVDSVVEWFGFPKDDFGSLIEDHHKVSEFKNE